MDKKIRGKNGGARPGAGRPKGSLNKLTIINRESLAEALRGSTEGIKEALATLRNDPERHAEYIEAVAKIAKYVVPVRKELSFDPDSPIKINLTRKIKDK